MAKTAFETNNALTKKAFDEKLFRDGVKESFFSKFMSEKGDNIVQVKTQLEKGQGDKITMPIRMRLTGAGKVGGETLEGNEEALTTYDSSVTLEQYRNAVRIRGKLDRKRPAFSITDEAKSAIQDWMTEKIDSLAFSAILNAPTKNFYLNSSSVITASASGATAKAALHATNSKLSLDLLSAVKASAKTGGNRAYTPLRPVKINGKDYYVFLTHPDALYDLKASSDFKQAMREAEVRGKENPLFTDAVAIWQGIIIHEHENITTFTDGGGASVAGCQSVFMGAQSLVWAWGARPETIMEEFDYKNELGYAIDMLAGVAKPVFNSIDYGSLGVWVARTNISGL